MASPSRGAPVIATHRSNPLLANRRTSSASVPRRSSSLRSSSRFSWSANDDQFLPRRTSFSQTDPNQWVQPRASRPRSSSTVIPVRDSPSLPSASRFEYSCAEQGPASDVDYIPTSTVPNFSRMYPSVRRPEPTLAMRPRSLSCTPSIRNSTIEPRIKRWDGLSRTAFEWDGLRRDMELWLPDGDCAVHLYARGQSKRGPSFVVPFEPLRRANCGALFSLCFAQSNSIPNSAFSSRRCSSYSSISPPLNQTKYELYIPAPDHCSREESFQWHITTRNFFAYVFSKPVVGACLGKSLVDLQERIILYRPQCATNQDEFLTYASDMGYLDFAHCSDHALAFLNYAEHYRLKDLFIDAFVHCVGMNDQLCLSDEFPSVRRATKALITRAYLEMDLHLGRVTRALSNFLEDELSSAYLGIGQGARNHLDRFRTFLYGFYVEKFGYWPPPEGSGFSKDLYTSMYFDFRSLYDYLVDLESTGSLLDQKPAIGGICVLQNVQAFDKRHNYTPLPNPMPLVPAVQELRTRTQSQRALVAFKLGTKQAKTEQYLTTRASLVTATNSHNQELLKCPLVKEYMRFEREYGCRLEEKVSVTDARKIRWILIYAVLQTLVSVIRAPSEVRDTEEISYPLCCQTTGILTWGIDSNSPRSLSEPPSIASLVDAGPAPTPATEIHASEEVDRSGAASPETAISIHPDCENIDYYAHKRGSSNNSFQTISSFSPSVEVPAPLRVNTSILRNTSIRSIKALSFSPFSSRRSSVYRAPSQPFCEIIVHGYGNGLNRTIVDPPSADASTASAEVHELPSHHLAKSKSTASLSALAPPPPIESLDHARTPILEASLIDHVHDPPVMTTLDHSFMDPFRAAPSASHGDESPASSLNHPIWSSGEESNSVSSAPSTSSSCSVDDDPSVTQPRRSSSVYSSDIRGAATAGVSATETLEEADGRPKRVPSLLGFDFQLSGEKLLVSDKSCILVKKSFSVESFKLPRDDVHIMDALKLLPAAPPAITDNVVPIPPKTPSPQVPKDRPVPSIPAGLVPPPIPKTEVEPASTRKPSISKSRSRRSSLASLRLKKPKSSKKTTAVPASETHREDSFEGRGSIDIFTALKMGPAA